MVSDELLGYDGGGLLHLTDLAAVVVVSSENIRPSLFS